jgi:16S rRNA processing protein RimM
MLLTVGRILRPHGVRGEVVVEVTTDEPAQRYAVGATLVAALSGAGANRGAGAEATDLASEPPAPRILTVEAQRPHQGRLLVVFKEVPDRVTAESLRGVLLQVDSEAVAAPADPDEFLDHQLVGLAVVTLAGEQLGTVARIDHAPAADLLVVERPSAGAALVPFVKAIVPEVDLAGGRVIVDPPPGLLDL